MTAAYRMRGLGWFFSGVVVALVFLLVSLQVAAERKKVTDISRAIAAAKRDIRMLETEFNTRANLAQLEKWNGDVLALTAPRAEQFMDDGIALAQVDFSAPGAHVDGVRAAAYVVPTLHPLPGLDLAVGDAPTTGAPQAQPAQDGTIVAARAVNATTIEPAPRRAPVAGAAVRVGARLPTPRATLADGSGAQPAARPAVSRAASFDVPSPRRSASIALLDRKLLSDSTIDDLMSTARAEARRR